MPVGSKLSGLENPNGKSKGRIYNILSQRPVLVEQIKKSQPDFDLDSFKPGSKKK